MDFGFTPQESMLRNAFREFLSKECSHDLVRELWQSPNGYSRQIWNRMCRLGWAGLMYEEKYGGSGCSLMDLVILFEEIGRALLPSPLFTSAVMSGMLINESGSPSLKDAYLPSIINGQKILTAALLNEAGEPDHRAPETEAKKYGEAAYVMSGVRSLVPFANAAEEVLLCARVTDENARDGGPALFRVPVDGDGVTCTELDTIYGEKKFVVAFDNAAVPSDHMIGEPGAGAECVEDVLAKAVLLKCAEMVGGAEFLVESTVRYAKERRQFGRPLAAFQMVQHYCADMHTLCVGARYSAYRAASLVNEGMETAGALGVAKAFCSDAYKQIAWKAQQIHGGIGFTEEYPIQLYYKHAKECELLFGDARYHRGAIADAMGY
jgi:alkylation response protein AidB-like acyl-CoA dehydrogenase